MSRIVDRFGLGSLVTGLTLLVAGAAIGRGFDTVLSHDEDPAELALFPREDWIRPFTLGRSELAADLIWLRAIQYYGEHRRSDRSYPYAETLFQTLTDLDPLFENAYIFGALVLHEQFERLDPSLALLDKGIEANPDSWWLPFERGFLLYISKSDQVQAAEWMARAGRKEGAPEWVGRLAAYAAQRGGDPAVARALWIEVYERTQNEEIRRVAWDYLADLGHPGFQGINPHGGDSR